MKNSVQYELRKIVLFNNLIPDQSNVIIINKEFNYLEKKKLFLAKGGKTLMIHVKIHDNKIYHKQLDKKNSTLLIIDKPGKRKKNSKNR